MKKHILALLLLAAAALAGAETMTVCLRGSVLYMRSSWDEKTDLVRICGLGGNKQFNYSYSALVDKKISDSDIMLKGKYYGRFHWCGDSTGVMHTYPEAPRKGVYILSGNHGYTGSEVTMPGHGYTQADIGKKLNETHRICGVLSKEKFRLSACHQQGGGSQSHGGESVPQLSGDPDFEPRLSAGWETFPPEPNPQRHRSERT